MKIAELIENLPPDLFPGLKAILLALAEDKDAPALLHKNEDEDKQE